MGLIRVIGCPGWVREPMVSLFGNMLGKGGSSSVHTLNSKWGNGTCIRFWFDHWCGDRPLCEMFPIVYCIFRHKDALVADYMVWQSGNPHWDVSLICHLHDWEVNPFQNFPGFLYSQRVTRGQTDWLCWSPARSGSFTVKLFY